MTKKELNIKCPFCRSKEKKRNGHSPNKLQRYMCKSCGHTYSERTGTVLHSLKKEELFKQYAAKMCEGYYTLKKMANEFNITISTSFYWRQKILPMLQSNINYESIVEISIIETFFNAKGRKLNTAHFFINNENHKCKLLISTDYSSESTSQITLYSIGKQKPEDIPNSQINQFRKNNVVPVSNKNKFIYEVFRHNKLQHKLTQADLNDTSSPIEIKRAPIISNLFKTLIHQKARGVSSKFLNNYAQWLLLLLKIHHGNMDRLNFEINTIWSKYIFTESKFTRFMRIRANNWYLRSDNRFWESAFKFNYNEFTA